MSTCHRSATEQKGGLSHIQLGEPMSGIEATYRNKCKKFFMESGQVVGFDQAPHSYLMYFGEG